MPLGFTDSLTATTYSVVSTVLIGLVFLVILPFTILALIKLRRRRDPARKFVSWLKASFFLFAITLCLLFVQGVMLTYEAFSDASHWHIVRGSFHIGFLADFFNAISATMVMVMLIEFGPSMRLAFEGKPDTLQKPLRYAAYILAFVIVTLALAFYGLSADFQENYTNKIGSIFSTGEAIRRALTIYKLISATSILLWIASLIIMGMSIFVLMERRGTPLESAAISYLFAGFFNLLSSTWYFAYAVHWLLYPRVQEYYVTVLTIILGWWSRAALLIIYYFVAAKSATRGGIWSHTGKNDYGHMP
nr:uncharacterized protein CTRU02_08400 [Colletotrichum truncatum]KAF6790271.1 hypothetical protein CTRU02_08400 [Colletotrichum truncatum]